MGPRAGLDRSGKSRPHWNSIPNRPARSQSLYGLGYPAHTSTRILDSVFPFVKFEFLYHYLDSWLYTVRILRVLSLMLKF